MSLHNWELDQTILFNRIKNAYASVPKNPTLGTLKARLEALDRNWNRFQKQHSEVLVNNAPEILTPLHYFKEDTYSVTEEHYLIAKGSFIDALSSLEGELQLPPPPVVNAGFSKSLPKLNIPTFSGKYTDWSNFRDLFTALIHSNTGISTVEKLAHLKAHVSGDAEVLLKNIPVSAENYQRAWELLESRYSNTRLLVSAYLSTLMSLKPVKIESAADLSTLFNTTVDCVEALSALRRPVSEWSDWLVHITVEKLDKQSRKDWEIYIGSSTEPPLFSSLKEFLQTQIRTLEAFQNSSQVSFGRSTGPQSSHQFKDNNKYRLNIKKSLPTAQTHVTTENTDSRSTPRKCFFCDEMHFLMYCPQFKGKDVQQRQRFVHQKNLCSNCFGSHPINDCRSKSTCRLCQGKHHTMIHPGSSHQSCQSKAGSSQPADSSFNVHTASIPTVASPVRSAILATARVRIRSSDGTSILVRALIDPCSEVTLISESLVQGLRLKRTSKSVVIVGVMNRRSGPTRGSVCVSLSPWFQSSFELTFNALVLPHLSSYIPKQGTFNGQWPDMTDVSLADPEFSKTKSIDLILGVDLYGILILPGLRKGDSSAPIAQCTELGWILSGPISCDSQPTAVANVCHISSEPTLAFDLQRFWEEQELQPNIPNLSSEERECEDNFLTTHSRAPDGAYIVRLPFKKNVTALGDSFTPALRMLQAMERRFSRNPTLLKNYSEFMTEYETLSHMERIEMPPSCLDIPGFFLPHHGVLRESSSTTKLRVVFNGSQKTNLGISLNDFLHTGPRLLSNLADILLRWRLHFIVFAADIEKMFRQIRIHPADQDWQRIIWREDQGQDLSAYKLTTVTYGLACSPFLALRTIRQLAADEEQRFPLAASILRRDIYVDDILSGSDSLELADTLQSQLRELCMAGGFTLRKFSSNSSVLLGLIPENLRTPTTDRSWESSTSLSILGLKWRPQEDVFIFPTTLSPLPSIITRRVVLSRIAQLYDPLGLLAPVIITAKIFIQSLWLLKLSWDDPLPENLSLRWVTYYSGLQQISNLQIPRWLNFFHTKGSYEIHGFSDASELAYSAVIYLRSRLNSGEITSRLITSKTRVAPLKKVSIPRLELNGALLLVQLAKYLTLTTDLQVPMHLWTDSTVVLAWIRKQPSCWPTYVSNRVSTIQTLVPTAIWHHVATSDNPADCASRGLAAHELSTFHLWWNGPSWLSDLDKWPMSTTSEEFDTDVELRRQEFTSHSVQIEPWDLLQRYSSLQKLLRVTSYCIRFVSRLFKRPSVSSTTVTASELRIARNFWVRHEQGLFFSDEIKALANKRPLPSKSRLLALTPFLDEGELLRVGGRLRNSLLSTEEKHPLILPFSSFFTTLVIRDCHLRCLHGGAQLTLSTLRQEYWILRGRMEVRKVIHRCLNCMKFRVSPPHQIMSDLPVRRVTESRPFSHTGVDYAGPVQIRTTKGRGYRSYKGWISVFVCLSSRAVHLEVVSDYSSEAFLAAYRRFISRRGICTSLSSDQGTTFVGADRELQDLFSSSSAEFSSLVSSLAELRTEWRFNPPAAPHFGGLWEAAVHSVKFHLKRTIGDSTLTFEEMSTFLSQVEACLNSRPLQALSDDPEDLLALTPGHLLIGQALNALPEPSLADLPVNRLSRWQYVQQLRDTFWRRWSSDYLKIFQLRSKWMTPTSTLKEGDLVLILHENLPPTKWPLGRILQLHPGKDNHVRVATVKVQKGTLVRPIVKLCKLVGLSENEQKTDEA